MKATWLILGLLAVAALAAALTLAVVERSKPLGKGKTVAASSARSQARQRVEQALESMYGGEAQIINLASRPVLHDGAEWWNCEFRFRGNALTHSFGLRPDGSVGCVPYFK